MADERENAVVSSAGDAGVDELADADDAAAFGEFEFVEVAPRRASRSSVLLFSVLSVVVAVALVATAVIGFRTVFRPTAQGTCVLLVQCFDVPVEQVSALTRVAIPDDARLLTATQSDGLKSKSLSAVILLGDTPLSLSPAFAEVSDFEQNSRLLNNLANLGFDSIDNVFSDVSSFGGGSAATVVFGRLADGSKLAALALRLDL